MVKKSKKTEAPKKEKGVYIEATGKRKTSVARVRIFKTGKEIIVNNIDYKKYFPTLEMQRIVESALKIAGTLSKVRVSALIKGGGIHSQAEALRHGISRVIIKENPEMRQELKKAGFLKRDSRMKERRKF
ncbi:30S ribosomal protein S9, partial [Patescibacteria group bacterium]